MKSQTALHDTVSSSGKRFFAGSMCIFTVLLLLAGAASVPFVFESTSILYKLEADKTLLRTGKVLGMLAATLLLLQLTLSARIRILDRIFALNNLYIVHRVNALCICVLALLHPLFVFGPEDIESIPVELKYWPEILGAVLLVVIWLITASGIWRLFLNFAFHRWWLFHRGITFAAALMLVTHVLFVSDTFESGAPRLIVLTAGGTYAAFFCWVKMKLIIVRLKPYTVTDVVKAGRDTYAVTVAPEKGNILKYIPGQFAFISFKSDRLSSEEHHFTISSSPARSDKLQFSIRCSGDWTRLIGRLSPGDGAYIDGAYGRFSYLITRGRELVMIAGGIGITPMLSMLRYMADTGDTRKTTLIWSNRTEEDIIFASEFADLETRLEGLRIMHIFTRQESGNGKVKRLHRDRLDEILQGTERNTPVFLCGPPPMMKQVREGLIHIGFSRKVIHQEKFSL